MFCPQQTWLKNCENRESSFGHYSPEQSHLCYNSQLLQCQCDGKNMFKYEIHLKSWPLIMIMYDVWQLIFVVLNIVVSKSCVYRKSRPTCVIQRSISHIEV